MMTHLSIVPHSFYFIRHGETDWNQQGRLMGQQDIPLNSRGIEQAHRAARHLESLGIERIASSPLSRAFQTAQIINSYLNVSLIVHGDLKEWGWGVKEGSVRRVIGTLEMRVREVTPEGAESPDVFQKRVLGAINRIIQQEQKTLIVGHGGLYWALMNVLGYPDSRCDNCVPYFLKPPEGEHLSWAVSPIPLVQ